MGFDFLKGVGMACLSFRPVYLTLSKCLSSLASI